MTNSNISPVPVVPPKSLGTSIIIIDKQIPVTNPPMTGVEMYLTARPALIIEKKINHKATMSAITGTTCIASFVPAVIPRVANALPVRAAGAASTPNTKS